MKPWRFREVALFRILLECLGGIFRAANVNSARQGMALTVVRF